MIWRDRWDRPSNPSSTAIPGEGAQLAAMAEERWDADGRLATLHRLIQVRLTFIRDRVARLRGRDPAADARPRAVTVFYDGACPLCAAEIGFYRRRRGADRVGWVDVSACQAENVAAGLTRDQALARFHVQDADGRLISGGQAFAILWTALPGYSWLGELFRRKPLAWAIDRAYDGFLKWRPRLKALAETILAHRGVMGAIRRSSQE